MTAKSKAARAVVFFIIMFMILSSLSYVLRKKESQEFKYRFLHWDTDYDALFFGSSHVHEAVDPLLLWQEFGIRSYNLASAGESVQITRYVVEEALKRTHPKVIFIDSYKIGDGEGLDQTAAFVHESIDAFPLSRTRLNAIRYASSLLDVSPVCFLSDIYAFHGRYAELDRKDFTRQYTRDGGAYIMTGVVAHKPPELTGTDAEAELQGGRGVTSYQEILSMAEAAGIKVVLMIVPQGENEVDEEYLNALKAMTIKAGGECLDGIADAGAVGIDYAMDFGDKEGHLNLNGAAKFTRYTGRFLKAMGLEDLRGDPAIADDWNAEVQAFSVQKAEMLEDKTDAVSYLYGAYDPMYRPEVYVRDKALLDSQYALPECIAALKAPVTEAGDEALGSSAYDMRIRVMSSDSGEQVAEQYFTFDDERSIFKTR